MTIIKTNQVNNNLPVTTENNDEVFLDDIDLSGDKPVPIEKLIKWRNQGLTYEEIGNLTGTSKQAAHQRLGPFRRAIETLPTFKEHKADILALLQSKLLSSLTDADIKSISPASRITSAAVLYDKERIERGLKGGANGNVVQVYMDFADKRNE